MNFGWLVFDDEILWSENKAGFFYGLFLYIWDLNELVASINELTASLHNYGFNNRQF